MKMPMTVKRTTMSMKTSFNQKITTLKKVTMSMRIITSITVNMKIKTKKAFTHYAKPQQLSFSGQFNMRVEITKTIGYEGGSFFSPDGKRLIFRASTPKTKEEIEKYKVWSEIRFNNKYASSLVS